MSTEQHNESFDNLFRDAFEGAKTQVPPSVWTAVSGATTGAVSTGVTTGLLSKILGIKGAAILGGVALVTTLYFANTNTENNGDSAPIQTTESNTSVSKNDKEIEANPAVDKETTKQETNQNSSNDLEDRASTTKPSNSANSASVVANSNNPTNNTAKLETTSATDKAINNPPTTPPSPKPFVDHSSPGAIVCTPEQVCLNQEATLSFDRNYGDQDKVTWYLNGAKLADNARLVKMIFTKKGLNLVKIKITTPDNVSHEMSRTFDISSTSANFEFKVEGNQVRLQSTSSNATNKWFVNNLKQNNSSSEILVPTNGMKSIEVIHVAGNLHGCSDTVTKTIRLANCTLESQLTNVITPYLLDGINDEWVVDLPPVEKYYLVIFAIDGSVVFETVNQNISWNGKRLNEGELLPVGVYTYQLVYGCNGNSESQTGKINLLK